MLVSPLVGSRTPLLGSVIHSGSRHGPIFRRYPLQSRRMSLTRVMAAVVLASILLSGCLSSARGTSSKAIDTESGPPVMPAEANALTEAGAMAFARHYIAQRDYAFVTGDLAPVDSLRDPSCDSCTSEFQVIDMTWLIGGR